LLRGLKYWPAKRPIFTTGSDAAYVSTTDICKTVFNRARIDSAVFASNVSAQSPPVRTKASPREAWANRSVRRSHSPANTNGGCARS
jgi:hypothetical protein